MTNNPTTVAYSIHTATITTSIYEKLRRHYRGVSFKSTTDNPASCDGVWKLKSARPRGAAGLTSCSPNPTQADENR